MGRSPSLDLRLKKIHALEDQDDSAALRDELRKALSDSSNRVVSAAVDLIGKLGASELIPEVRGLWTRFMERPVETDKGCVAKTSIVEALNRLNVDDPDFFLSGMKYVQLEPTWERLIDVAGNLRGACAFAIARSKMIGPNDKFLALTDLLVKPDHLSRLHAVNALVDWGYLGVEAILRVMLSTNGFGDDEVVLAACCNGLLSLSPQTSIEFLSRFLNHPNETVVLEVAASLGQANKADAVAALIRKLGTTTDRELEAALLTSIGLSRHPDSIGFLLSVVSSSSQTAEIALRALAPSRFYAGIRDQVAGVVEATQSRRLQAVFDEAFGV